MTWKMYMDKKTKKEHVLTLFMVRNFPLKMYGENSCSIEIARGNEIMRN